MGATFSYHGINKKCIQNYIRIGILQQHVVKYVSLLVLVKYNYLPNIYSVYFHCLSVQKLLNNEYKIIQNLITK
jgi:hypothetical protein